MYTLHPRLLYIIPSGLLQQVLSLTLFALKGQRLLTMGVIHRINQQHEQALKGRCILSVDEVQC